MGSIIRRRRAKPGLDQGILSIVFLSEVHEQLLRFKLAERSPTCRICWQDFNHREIVVDHFSPTLKELMDEFLVAREAPTRFIKDRFGRFVMSNEFTDIAEEWKLFHRINASLRLICRECNARINHE